MMVKELTLEECESEIERLNRMIHLKGMRARVKQLQKEAGE